eukprot:scaffold13791_cov36-Cyclotella_meneghiniana.AAC.1
MGVADGRSNSPLSMMHTSGPPSPVKSFGKNRPLPVLVGAKMALVGDSDGTDVIVAVGNDVGISEVGRIVSVGITVGVGNSVGFAVGNAVGNAV